MSYLRYVSLSASMVRNSLRPDLRAVALTREEMNTVVNEWADGKPMLESARIPSYRVKSSVSS
eukprot:CAMPEP_0119132708 /NCGR_PEP_ID=MMETSP1310-20130426/12155_1 /TAXON_ID=464262 /ORGANISM="Genus nov. species nov., Strain RCC2339" /LENGTH=62 /DNA_ID=CAMNT_0007123359 /DNA_START=161 /DNA_END=349 /DNA_ORIENTATION=+